MKKIEHNGKSLTIEEWANELGVSTTTVYRRLAKGNMSPPKLTARWQSLGKYMVKKGMKDADLAWKLKTNRKRVMRWRLGICAPQTKMLPSIANALGCKVSDLVNDMVQK